MYNSEIMGEIVLVILFIKVYWRLYNQFLKLFEPEK